MRLQIEFRVRRGAFEVSKEAKTAGGEVGLLMFLLPANRGVWKGANG